MLVASVSICIHQQQASSDLTILEFILGDLKEVSNNGPYHASMYVN